MKKKRQAIDRLDEIEARAGNATDGPWHYPERILGLANTTVFVADHSEGVALVRHSDTAEFIAHARTDVPALVAALRAVLDMHFLPAPPSDEDPDPYACCDLDCPCPTVRAITAVLDN